MENITQSLNAIEVRSYFVRERNALLVRGQFAAVYEDYYLHLLQHSLKNSAQHDEYVKDIMAAITLHLCSRPWKESTAWTLNLNQPPINLFATGDSISGSVTGRIFTEDIRTEKESRFIAQVRQPGNEPRTSTVAIANLSNDYDVFAAVEAYYMQSEQRLTRLFRYAPEDIVMLSAQPDCDLNWLRSLDTNAIRRLDQDEELSLLETRKYAFNCGCSLEKLLPVLASMSTESRDYMFSENDPAVISCPRCGAIFLLKREQLDAYVE